MSIGNDIRHGLTKKVVACNMECYVTLNFYDGSPEPLEVFIRIAKMGSTLSGFIDVWAMTISKALRGGIKWGDLRKMYLYQKFEPSDQHNPSIVHAITLAIDGLIQYKKDLWDELKDIDAELDTEEAFNANTTASHTGIPESPTS